MSVLNPADHRENEKGTKMTPIAYSARELYDWLLSREDFLLLDVRNDVEFGRFKVEGPHPFDMVNVPYMEFIEHEDESVARVPQGRRIRIVCAKEGSARYVGEILETRGFTDIGYLTEGIKSWGNMLAPVRIDGGDDYEFVQFQRPGKASLSYGLLCGDEMMVFDPAKNIAAYETFARDHGCTIVKTFETHRQADYISGSLSLHRSTGAAIVAPEADFKEAAFPYTPAGDGNAFTFSAGGPVVRAIHTPGHTPGSTCYLIDDRYLVSGDTVFIHSIGRPDLGGMVREWSRMLFNTMRHIIHPMDDACQVFPGHYSDWKEAGEQMVFTADLGSIKRANGEIYGITDADRFYAFIRDNMRPQPEEYAKIREINAGLIQESEEQQDILDLGKNECAASMMKPAGD